MQKEIWDLKKVDLKVEIILFACIVIVLSRFWRYIYRQFLFVMGLPSQGYAIVV